MNPDQVLIRELQNGGTLPAPLDSNPLSRALMAEVVALPAEGGITLAFTFGPDHLQGRGVVQGGMVASGLDFALGMAPFTHLPEGMTLATTNLNVSFLRPLLPGRVTVEAIVDRAGRTAGYASGKMFDAAGRAVATGMATLSIFPNPVAA